MKRTTLILNERTFADVKQLAAEQQRNISEVVDDFLRDGLRRQRARPQPKRLRLPTYDLGEPRVDIADRNALYELMEGE